MYVLMYVCMNVCVSVCMYILRDYVRLNKQIVMLVGFFILLVCL